MNTIANNRPQMQLTPIGVVKSALKKPTLSADEEGLTLNERMDRIKTHHREVAQTVSELIVDPQWTDLLDGIEDFSHVLVIYWPHLIDPQRRSLRKVHPMGRKDIPLKGIFATCSPARPNPVLVSAVALVSRKKNVLKVRGFEALDGSPIVDIKPYSKHYLQVDDLKSAEWMDAIHKELQS